MGPTCFGQSEMSATPKVSFLTNSMKELDDRYGYAREYSASEIRKILQRLFPERRLVLSQFTFFNQTGVARPTGETYRRGRRCYRLEDILSIACVLALKEQGIPLKNIQEVPRLIQENARRIFDAGCGVQLSGYGEVISLRMPGESISGTALEAFLSDESPAMLFWGFDAGFLAEQLREIAAHLAEEVVSQAA